MRQTAARIWRRLTGGKASAELMGPAFTRVAGNCCKLLISRYNGAARRQAGLLWWALPVPPQRSAVNPVRPGREQPQR